MLIKNLLFICIAVLAWYLTGYGLYNEAESYVGANSWLYASAGHEKVVDDHYLYWSFDITSMFLCPIFFSGPLAERTRLIAYGVYAVVLTAFVYPVISAWVWGNGWLMDAGF